MNSPGNHIPQPAGVGLPAGVPGSSPSMTSQFSGSSYTVLTNHTGSSQAGSSFSNGIGNGSVTSPHSNVSYTPVTNGNSVMSSLTDISLEQAMEKVQELASENASLREYLKENNDNMKKQFQTLLQWKERVRDSNQQNLSKFESLHRQISLLKTENDKYRQCLATPEKQGSILAELQTHVRRLENEKHTTQHEVDVLRTKVEELKQQLHNKSPADEETVFVNTFTDEKEIDAYKTRCHELAAQVQNFHQQNEQLMLDLQQVNTLKQAIQAENSTLNEDNLELQKKLQSFLGDMNKAKHSVGGTPADVSKAYNYTMGEVAENDERETKTSVSAKQDMEILQLQTTSSERLKSGEALTSEMTSELRSKLQHEKHISFEQKQKLGTQDAKICQLQSQVEEKSKMLAHYKQQLDSQLAHVTQQHEQQQQDLLRQLDGLNAELQHTKSSLPYMGEVQNFKSQVMTLISECQELTGRLETATKALDMKSARVMELEQIIRKQGDEHQQSRVDADSLISQLRYSLTTMEDNINRERTEHATTKKQLTELRASFNQLVNDYKELLDTFDENKAQQQSQQQGSQNKQLMDEINRLTAQTIAAEEAITYRDDQIKQLKMDNTRLKDDVENTIPVLRAQADVWKQDFDAERYARERQVAEKEHILQEMKNLELKNQQLIDEQENYSRKSLAEMQRRHAPGSYNQQMQNYLQVGNQGHQGHQGHQAQHPAYPPQHSPGAGYPPQQQQQNIYPNQPVEHGGGEDPPQFQGPQNPPQQQPQPHSHSNSNSSHPEDGEVHMSTCPKCGLSCPDIDTLQIHVVECLDN